VALFCSIEGLQPSLSLLTRDGALLSDDDPVLLVVGSEEVMSTVISWNIPPLTDRYMEACQFLHSGIVSSWPYRENLCVCVSKLSPQLTSVKSSWADSCVNP